MRLFRAVKDCTRRDLIGNDYIRMGLRIAESLNEKIVRYKTEWRLHVQRMDTTGFSRTTDVYKRQHLICCLVVVCDICIFQIVQLCLVFYF